MNKVSKSKQVKATKRRKAVKKALNLKRQKSVPKKVRVRAERVERKARRVELKRMFVEEIQNRAAQKFNAEVIEAEVISEQSPA